MVRKPLHSAPRWSVAGWSGRALLSATSWCSASHPWCDTLPTPTASRPNFHIHSWLPSHAIRGWCGDCQTTSSAVQQQGDPVTPLGGEVSSLSTHSEHPSYSGTWVWMKGSVKLPTVDLVWGQDIIKHDPSDLLPHVSSLCGVWGKGIPLGRFPFKLFSILDLKGTHLNLFLFP